EPLWRATGTAELIVLDARSAFGGDASGVIRRFKADSAQGLRRLNGRPEAAYLARALLRHNRSKEALAVLEAFSPPSAGTDLNRVKPDILVLLSRARYLVGLDDRRSDFALAREDLANMAITLPVVRPLLELLQELTAPTNVPAIRSGPVDATAPHT